MYISDDQAQKYLSPQKNRQKLRTANFCIPGILSKCSAGITWTEHRYCKFAIKSEYSNKCMYFIESIDGHCDSLDAQKDSIIIDSGF